MTDSEQNRVAHSGHAETAASSAHASVLLVAESHKMRRMAREALGKAGYNVLTAADGFDALAKVVAYRPSVVLADTVLPRLDGYQTCGLIRNNVDYQEVSVIMLTGGPLPFDETRARMVGIDSYLSKPLTEGVLLEAIEQYVPAGTHSGHSVAAET